MLAIVLLVLLSGGGGGWYVYTGFLNPARTCKKCDGLGFKHFIGRTYTMCKKCDGYGWVFRLAARHVRRDRTPASRQAQVRKRAQAQARFTREQERRGAR
jgi:hypothetical protein